MARRINKHYQLKNRWRTPPGNYLMIARHIGGKNIVRNKQRHIAFDSDLFYFRAQCHFAPKYSKTKPPEKTRWLEVHNNCQELRLLFNIFKVPPTGGWSFFRPCGRLTMGCESQ